MAPNSADSKKCPRPAGPRSSHALKVLPSIIAIVCVIAVIFGLTQAGYLTDTHEGAFAGDSHAFVSKDEFNDELTQIQAVIEELSTPTIQTDPSGTSLTYKERKSLKRKLTQLVQKYQKKEGELPDDADCSHLAKDLTDELDDLNDEYGYAPLGRAAKVDNA